MHQKPSTAMILIVDDEELLRRTFSNQLEDSGYVTYSVPSYSDAIKELEKNRYDVVVSDIMLGDHTGVDLLEWLRERDNNSPVILITGHPNVSSASDAIRLQAFEYLCKPVHRDELVRAVQHAVSLVRLREEKQRLANELKAIFYTMTEAVFTVDSDLTITRANRAFIELLELQDSDPTNSLISNLPVKGIDRLEDLLQKVSQTGDIIENEHLELNLANGRRVLVSANITALPSTYPESNSALVVFRDKTRLHKLQNQVHGRKRMGDLVGHTPVMLELFQQIEDIAETDSTVLILGETGTGKEVVANTIHHYSTRSNKPFVAINCAVFSEGVLESELFGHVKGAFTNAVSNRIGRFEAANGGTVFLDEIGDLPQAVQLKLLRVIQERKLERVGDNRSIDIDIRIIAATHRDLRKLIRDGKFREDLFYRLNVAQVDVPPLRERKDDIPLLTEYFRNQLNRSMRKSIDTITPDTLDAMMSYDWPGNIREFINALERAFIGCHGNTLQPSDLPKDLLTSAVSTSDQTDVQDEAARIRELMTQTDGNIAKTARILGVARNTLYRKLKKFGILLEYV